MTRKGYTSQLTLNYMSLLMNIYHIIQELEKYTSLENDDFSNACDALIIMYDHRSILSGALKAEIEEEIKRNLEWYLENTVITETTITPEPYTELRVEPKEDMGYHDWIEPQIKKKSLHDLDRHFENSDELIEQVAKKYNCNIIKNREGGMDGPYHFRHDFDDKLFPEIDELPNPIGEIDDDPIREIEEERISQNIKDVVEEAGNIVKSFYNLPEDERTPEQQRFIDQMDRWKTK